MNLVFMSDTLTPDKKEDVDLLPFNSYSSGQFFEYTRLDNDLLRDKKWDNVNITEELPSTERYVIVYDTFDAILTMENVISRNSTVSKNLNVQLYFFTRIYIGPDFIKMIGKIFIPLLKG
jgi:hypothetical protein